MEFVPVLDPACKPEERIWYSLMPSGSAPGVSVGHTCMFMPSGDGGMGRIVIIGGANPNGSFSDSHMINLDKHAWETSEWSGLEARYEHCSFIPESCPQSLWVFGGAQQTGNRNSIQKVQLTDSEPCWKDVVVKGEPPSPRTYHTNTACIGDQLYVFSGGEVGAVPVSDTKLHVFDTVSLTWSQPETQGRQPPARHGHIIVAVGSKIYIHGGMAGDKFHNDMYSIDSRTMKWRNIQTKGDVLPGVAAHSAVVLEANIYIFGGITADGATNSMYRYSTDKNRLTLMTFKGDVPPNRLDHAMCLLPWKLSGKGVGEQADSEALETIHLAFVFGGMDTHGVIHNDCFVTVLK